MLRAFPRFGSSNYGRVSEDGTAQLSVRASQGAGGSNRFHLRFRQKSLRTQVTRVSGTPG